MRKYILIVPIILALCLFTAFAAAQSSTSNDNNNNSSGSSIQNGGTTSSQSGASGMQNDQSTAGSIGSTSDQASNSASAKTLEGCIVKENTDYFIQPASGDRERLSSSQDLSSQVGHHVRVEGSEQSNTAASNNRTSTSGSASSETQNNANGSIAGNAGSSNATGTGPAANNSWNGKDFLVTKVDTISESCPADIQNKINQNQPK